MTAHELDELEPTALAGDANNADSEAPSAREKPLPRRTPHLLVAGQSGSGKFGSRHRAGSSSVAL